MRWLDTALISCPYCGEQIELLIDPSIAEQDYVEDCSVCCRPIRLLVTIEFDGSCYLAALRDDE